MNPFWKSDTYKVLKTIRSAQKVGLIEEWVRQAGAIDTRGQDGDALRAWLSLWQHRPFYTANELAPLIPALALGLGISTRWKEPHSPKRLREELLLAGIPRLQNADGTLEFHGKEYFIVESFGYWKRRKLTMEEFNELLNL